MNDPNTVPLDRIPVSTPSIPRFGGLPELPELPGEFAPLPPYRTPTSVTTIPFPSAPPKVVVEPPKAPPKVTVELPKPVVKASPPDTTSSTAAPQPRWVREAIQDLLTPNRKKALALTVAAGLIAGAIALNAGFSGIGSPTRSSNSLVAATTPEKPPPSKPEEPPPQQIMEKVYPRDDVWGRIFRDGGKWNGSSQLAMPDVTELSMADIPYARFQPQVVPAAHSEPQAPSAPVTGPPAAVAIPLMACTLNVLPFANPPGPLLIEIVTVELSLVTI